MLLKSIKLNNFRQFVDESIDFSTDPDKNVTIIVGENGSGKTTFAQAFLWCLYGQTSFSDKNLLNKDVAKKMLPDEVKNVRVSITLKHGDAIYEIIRNQQYSKTYSNTIKPGTSTSLNISVKTADGNLRYIKPDECLTEIKRILPKELSSYFFFDGEKIEKMSKDISAGKKVTDFKEAVQGLTGLNAMLQSIEYLNPKSSKSVIGKINEDYKEDSEGKIAELTNIIDVKQRELSDKEIKVQVLNDNINIARTIKQDSEIELKKFDEVKEIQYQKEKLLLEIRKAELVRSSTLKTMYNSINQNISDYLSAPLVSRVLDILNKSEFKGKEIPEMHSKTIKYLLDRKKCICGTCLDPGTIPYQKVNELYEYLPPKSVGVMVGNFIKSTKEKYSRNIDFFDEISTSVGSISEQNDIINSFQTDYFAKEELLNKGDYENEIKILVDKINTSQKVIKEGTSEKENLLISIGKLETEIKLKENERTELSLMDKNNRIVELNKAYANTIYDEMYKEYKAKEDGVKKELELSINEIFKTIYNGGLSLSIDDNYNITVFVNEYDGNVETSTAQSISVIFAFITAIIKMAKEKRNKDETFSEPYPLVMDAPLSAFDKRRIQAICESIPNIAEQVIIFIKDTDGEIAEQYLGSKILKRHRFVKKDEFNTSLE